MCPIQNTVQIIMVTYFRPNDLVLSLNSIIKHTTLPYHLHIIDNSRGSINHTLMTYDKHPNITVTYNDSNLGKGVAFMKQYRKTNHTMPYFISIDGDVIVPPNWLERIDKAYWDTEAAILAPIIADSPLDTFASQLSNDKFIMHNVSRPILLQNGIFRCRHIAGPLFVIKKSFFDIVNGYPTTQLYGNEDGELCRKAHELYEYTGIISDMTVIHSNIDSDALYQEWKLKNVKNPTERKGRWD